MKATGGSDNYDKEERQHARTRTSPPHTPSHTRLPTEQRAPGSQAHDRLLAKAHAFTAEIAARYPASLEGTSASGASAVASASQSAPAPIRLDAEYEGE